VLIAAGLGSWAPPWEAQSFPDLLSWAIGGIVEATSNGTALSVRFIPVLKMRNIRSLLPLIATGELFHQSTSAKIRPEPLGPFGKSWETKSNSQAMQHELGRAIVENCEPRLPVCSKRSSKERLRNRSQMVHRLLAARNLEGCPIHHRLLT
jgi:hypothetical protein